MIRTESPQIYIAESNRKRSLRNEIEAARVDAQRRVVVFSRFETNAGSVPAFFLAIAERCAAAATRFISVSKPVALAPVNSPFIATTHRVASSGTGFFISLFHSSREGDHHGNR